MLQIFLHHKVNTAPEYWLFCIPLKPPATWFLCVCANGFGFSTRDMFLLIRGIFTYMVNSSLTLCHPRSPASFLNNSAVFWVCAQGNHRESWWYFGCGLITDGLGFLGGFFDLISYIFPVTSPSLGWPNCKHWFSQTNVVIFFFRLILLHGAVTCKAFDTRSGLWSSHCNALKNQQELARMCKLCVAVHVEGGGIKSSFHSSFLLSASFIFSWSFYPSNWNHEV